jgi:hypothetical protein
VENNKAMLILKGWCSLTEQYGKGMRSLSEFCVEKNGHVVTDEKRKKKMLEEREAVDSSKTSGAERRAFISSAGLGSGEKCGGMVQRLADSAGSVGGQYEEMVEFLKKEILPELGE